MTAAAKRRVGGVLLPNPGPIPCVWLSTAKRKDLLTYPNFVDRSIRAPAGIFIYPTRLRNRLESGLAASAAGMGGTAAGVTVSAPRVTGPGTTPKIWARSAGSVTR